MLEVSTLSDLLNYHKAHAGGITFVEKGDKEDFLSYSDLFDAAANVSSYLNFRGMRPGDELIFQIDDNRSFVILFWGCILGGIIPVPVTTGRNNGFKQKLFNIWKILSTPYLVSGRYFFDDVYQFAGDNNLDAELSDMRSRFIDVSAALSFSAPSNFYKAKSDEIAFIQFSSGSTDEPKGVILTHENLLTNVAAIARASKYSQHDRTLSWMPLTHDMGLIGFHISPLFSGMDQVIISSSFFIQRPSVWMETANSHRCSVLSSPNFGYSYFLKHCANQQYDWDLSSIRIIYNGAEPISESLCHQFSQNLKPYGLRGVAIRPVYGLAEASVAVTISDIDLPVKSLGLNRDKIKVGDEVEEVEPGVNALSIVNVGRVIQDCFIKITDGFDNILPPNIIGHVEISGGNVTKGYYNQIAATKSLVSGTGWVKTGDLGFLREGELYITGRFKDIIFYNGQNYYPHDLERCITEAGIAELNKVVVVGYFNVDESREEIIVFLSHKRSLEEFNERSVQLKKVLNNVFNLSIYTVVPVKDIPKTTSGKLKRFSLLEDYRSGKFSKIIEEASRLKIALGLQGRKAPVSLFEQELSTIWSEVLGVEYIGVDEDFFDLGGNSLLAAEVEMKIFKKHRRRLPGGALYSNRSIEKLAEAISLLREESYIPIGKSDKRKAYPLTNAQSGIFYAWQSNTLSTAYNLPVAFRLDGHVDPLKLQSVIRQLVERHDSLRMSFAADDEPCIIVNDESAFDLEIVSINDRDLQAEMRKRIQPFDLLKAAAFRICLFDTGNGNYILFMDFHHIIMDGISVSILMSELLKLYDGQMLDNLPASYTDYAIWEKSDPGIQQFEDSREFWSLRLIDDNPALSLNPDFIRPPVFTYAGKKVKFKLDKDISGKLREIADEHNVSLHALLFSLYYILLSTYTGQEQIIIGIPVSGRRHLDVLSLAGMFVNNVPVKMSSAGDMTFKTFLLKVFEEIQLALENQLFPFDQMVKLTGKKRDASRHPVFDTMFVFQDMSITQPRSTGFSMYPVFFDPRTSKYDISMEIFDTKGDIEFAFEFCTDLFKESSIEDMAAHFCHIAAQIAANQMVELKNIQLLTGEEIITYINEYNNSFVATPGKSIHQLFVEQAQKTPEKIALLHNNSTFTYSRINRESDALAACLIKSGIGKGCIVSLVMKRSASLVVALLSILKASGTYLLIEEGLPAERIKYIVEDSKSKAVIYSSADGALPFDIFYVATNECVLIDLHSVKFDDLSSGPAQFQECLPGDIAYVLYTSGTTGNPKGVMIEHQSLVNYILWAVDKYAKDRIPTFPLFTSISFDLTITSLFTPLVTGGKIIVYDDQPDELLIASIIKDNKSTVIKLTPSHLSLILDSNLSIPPDCSVQCFIVGGERLDSTLSNRIYSLFKKNVAIYNEYGPTETTVGCMIHKFDPREAYKSVPIGRPAANTGIYLLDKYMRHVPANVTGELFVSGKGVGKGYLFNDSLTRQKFIDDPFDNGKQIYKTGDLAKRSKDGIIEYLGRMDAQIKINGYRIELSEISHRFNQYKGIEFSLPFVKLREDGIQIIGVYYTGEVKGDEREFRKYMALYLPFYMVPSFFIHIEQIPITINGKIDPSRLPDPFKRPAGGVGEQSFDEIEMVMKTAWDFIFKRETGVAENFFDLGGDSIKAFQIASFLRGKGFSVNVKDILTYQTIREIRPSVVQTKRVISEQSVVEGVVKTWPASGWFFSIAHQEPGYYNQSVMLDVEGKIDMDILNQTFRLLFTYYDELRLNWGGTPGIFFYNSIATANDFFVDYHAILAGAYDSDFDQKNEKEEIENLCSSIKNFDIFRGLLMKALVIKRPSGKELLFITAHHLIIDGISWRIFLQSLCSIYSSLKKMEVPRFSEKTASLRVWREKLRSSQVLNQQIDYWHSKNEVEFDIPQDSDTDDWKVSNGRTIGGELSELQTSLLIKDANRPYKTTAEILLNVILLRSLKKWTGKTSFLIEQEGHGRDLDNIDVSGTIGWFTAFYPVEFKLLADNPGSQIEAVKDQVNNIPTGGIGYGVHQYLNGKNKLSPPKLSPIRFNYLGNFSDSLNRDLFSFSSMPHGSDSHPSNLLTAKIEINCFILDSKLSIQITFNSKAHRSSTIRNLIEIFQDESEIILSYLENNKKNHFAPTDFNAANLNKEELDTLFN